MSTNDYSFYMEFISFYLYEISQSGYAKTDPQNSNYKHFDMIPAIDTIDSLYVIRYFYHVHCDAFLRKYFCSWPDIVLRAKLQCTPHDVLYAWAS